MSAEIGFSGSQRGMTEAQRATVARLLQEFYRMELGVGLFRHGHCRGADEQAAMIAGNIGYVTVAYPGADTPDKWTTFVSTYTRAAYPNLERNQRICDDSMIMIAAPAQDTEVLRSGTWATIRRARKDNVPLFIVGPEGNLL